MELWQRVAIAIVGILVLAGFTGLIVAAIDHDDGTTASNETPVSMQEIAANKSGIHVIGYVYINGNRVYKVRVDRKSIPLTCLIWDGYKSGAISCIEGD